MRTFSPIAIVCVLLGTGCAEYQYVYIPAVGARTMAGNYPAAYYAIPSANKRGDLRVTTFGVTKIQAQKDGQELPALQVRLVIANDSDPNTWSIDTREQLLDISGVGQSRPALANTDAGAPPIVQIPKGQRSIVDLFYPLPPELGSNDKLPAFSVRWKINTGSGIVAQSTPFHLEKVETAYASGDDYSGYGYPGYIEHDVALGYGYGYAPYWWYDPLYPSFGFYHYPIVIGRLPYRIYGGPYWSHYHRYGPPRRYYGWGGYYRGWGHPGWGGRGYHPGGSPRGGGGVHRGRR